MNTWRAYRFCGISEGAVEGALVLLKDEKRRDEDREERDDKDDQGTETEMMAWYHSRLVGTLHAVNAHVEGGDQGDEWSDERHEAAQDV